MEWLAKRTKCFISSNSLTIFPLLTSIAFSLNSNLLFLNHSSQVSLKPTSSSPSTPSYALTFSTLPFYLEVSRRERNNPLPPPQKILRINCEVQGRSMKTTTSAPFGNDRLVIVGMNEVMYKWELPNFSGKMLIYSTAVSVITATTTITRLIIIIIRRIIIVM